MKVADVKPAAAAGGLSRTRQVAAGRVPPPAAGAGDDASILGIPQAELTPRVQAAVSSLIGELQALRRQLERMQDRVAELERLADRDTLTPLANRRAFARELDRTIAHIERHGSRASLVYIDLDGLKEINDRYGHAAGDRAIVHFSEVVSDNVRRTDLVGRLGGDEFALLLVETDPERARAKAEGIAEMLRRRPLRLDRTAVPLHFSFGVEPLLPGRSGEEILDAADRAMYAQKQAKRALPAAS